MKKYCYFLLLAGSILLFITACENAATGTADNNDTAEFDMSKARAWIDSVNAKFQEDVKRGDTNAMAAHYSSDAWLMFDNREPLKGNDIASAWGESLRTGLKELKLNTQDVIGNGELMAETGEYEMIGENNKTLDKGKYLVVWKKENGEWKIYRDIANSNMPANK